MVPKQLNTLKLLSIEGGVKGTEERVMATNERSLEVVSEEGEIIEAPQELDLTGRAEIDVQIATAHRYPRSVSRFQKEALAMATVNEDTAASCFYALPRKDKSGQMKNIEGPSVRLAEIVGSSWGNIRYGARIVREEKDFIVAQGSAHDLERNVAMTIEVKRRITDKHGKKYSFDMIAVTANAACSIALRNAIFKVVPKTFVDSIYAAAKKVAVGNASTLANRRLAALDYFKKMGVQPEQVLAVLEREGIEDIDLKDLETLTGYRTAITEGDAKVDDIFPPLSTLIMPRRQSENGKTETDPEQEKKPKEQATENAVKDPKEEHPSGDTPPPAENPSEEAKARKVLSEKQIKRVFAIAKEHGFEADDVKEYVKLTFGSSMDDLDREQYDRACAFFEKKKGAPK